MQRRFYVWKLLIITSAKVQTINQKMLILFRVYLYRTYLLRSVKVTATQWKPPHFLQNLNYAPLSKSSCHY